jgi:hypothetical protein
MENEIISVEKNYTDVRYNTVYSVIYIILAIFFIALIIIMNLANSYLLILWIILIPFLLMQGILAFRGRKYLKHDKQNKIFLIDGSLGIRDGRLTYYKKYKYDRIYFTGEGASRSLYVEINGKKKYISLSKFICNKGDYEIFYREITG